MSSSSTTLACLGTGGYHANEWRHTACYMLAKAGIVLDAGSGFFRVRDLLCTPQLDIFLSHTHLDHCYGLTFLLDCLFEKPVDRVTIHARPSELDVVKNSLYGSPLFSVPFRYDTQPLASSLELGDWTIRTHQQERHPGGSMAYRLDSAEGSIVYMTDVTCDLSDTAALEFAQGADILLHECYFSDRYIELAPKCGHSSASEVGRFAAAAGAKRLEIVHVNPISDAEELAEVEAAVRREFPNAHLANDRSEIPLTR